MRINNENEGIHDGPYVLAEVQQGKNLEGVYQIVSVTKRNDLGEIIEDYHWQDCETDYFNYDEIQQTVSLKIGEPKEMIYIK